MNKRLRKSLHELYQEFHEYDAKQPDRLNRWRNVEPESALFLSILVRSRQAKQVLEMAHPTGFLRSGWPMPLTPRGAS
jgi:predicted O-methyltransferase YrrM